MCVWCVCVYAHFHLAFLFLYFSPYFWAGMGLGVRSYCVALVGLKAFM